MKYLAFGVFLALSPFRATAAVDAPKGIEAIRLVEHWDGKTVGAAGEIGPWQILPAVWRQYSAVDQRIASPAEHRRVAAAHFAWIVAGLPGLGLPVTIRSVALVWNAGYGVVLRRRDKPRHRDYADRVSNVYSTLR